jgi:Tol biopolymer transport system component
MSRLQLTATLAGALVLILATPADATYPGDNGRIAYGNFITGQIYTISPDGTDRLQVTAVGPTHFADGPSWSPDGQSIAFEKHTPRPASDVSDIWIMDADGDHPERIAGHGKLRYYTPAFSPDGTRIVFTRCKPGDGVCAIWDMAADGSDERALTPYVHDTTNEAVDFHPVYAPDGNTIVFDRFYSDGELSRLFTMDADGDNEEPLTSPDLEAFGADYAPDGQTVVFGTHAPRIGSNIWTVDENGSNPQELTPDPYPNNNFFPSYSPEGDQVVYVSDRRYDDFCCTDLFLTPATGGAEVRLHGIGHSGPINPSWGPAP